MQGKEKKNGFEAHTETKWRCERRTQEKYFIKDRNNIFSQLGAREDVVSIFALPLNELEAASRFLAAVLLRFLHARIACEEPAGSQLFAQAIVILEQRASDAELDRAGLASDAAAVGAGTNIEPAIHREMDEWAADEDLQHRSTKILLEVSIVDADVALAGRQPDAGDRALAAARSVIGIA